MTELIGLIDLGKYGGEWLEMARKPISFEKKCVAAKAFYDDIEYKDGKPYKLKVRNSCLTKQDKIKVSTGKAKVEAPNNRSLSVSFSFFTDWMDKVNYEVLYVDENYQNALVGSPDKKYFWILSRKVLPKQEINALLEKAKQKGYDISDVIYNDWDYARQNQPSFLGL